MENDRKELQLLPIPYTKPSYSQWPSDLLAFRSYGLPSSLDKNKNNNDATAAAAGPSLDLQLSITLRPIQPPLATETIKWRAGAADQVRLAATESAYAERVMEMTRREMEMAQLEFARAKHMWERAREELERVEKMKEKATRHFDACMEITCQACRRNFRP